MSIDAQFIMAALAFTLGMIWTCITIQEHQQPKKEVIKEVAVAEKEEDNF